MEFRQNDAGPLVDRGPFGRASAFAAAVLIASACHTLQVGYFLQPAGRPIPIAFFWAHLLWLILLEAAIAVSLHGRRSNRLWAAAAFLLPAASAAAASVITLGSVGTGTAVWGTIAGATLILGAWSLQPLPGAPVLAGILGGAVGGEILRYRLDIFQGWSTEPLSFGILMLALASALGLAILGGCLPSLWRVPNPQVALALAVAAVACAWGLGRTSGLWRVELTARGDSRAGAPLTVLVVLDTVRADHLRLYGYERDTMPALEEFVLRECVQAPRAVANYPSSLETHASLFTGLYPPRNGATAPRRGASSYYPLDESVPTLASLLAKAGYWTVGLSANNGPLAPNFGLGRGFDLYRAVPDELKRRSPWRVIPSLFRSARVLDALPLFGDAEFFTSVPYRRASAITDEAIAVLDAAGTTPLFLFLNYFDAHEPYSPPMGFLDSFEGRNAELPLGDFEASLREAVTSDPRALTAAERSHLVALYDAELRYLDRELGRLLDRLREHPRWTEAMVIITSDHGEALGEHGLLGHGLHLYDELVRVPFFVKPARNRRDLWAGGQSFSDTRQSVDVFPMILEYARIAYSGEADGVGWREYRTRSFAWSFPGQLRSIESEGMKLIEASGRSYELYDLEADPNELRNLASLQPETVSRLAGLLGRQEEEPQRTSGTEDVPPDVLKRLRALGYAR